MMSSRLNASTNNHSRWMARLCIAGLALFVVTLPAVAHARRRIVILDFDGPKAQQFRVDVERIVKKQHTVIPVDKWNAAAEEMDATSLSEKNVKKVAKRLNIDGVISGKVEKRRDEYILRLKVREGKTGEVVGNPIDSKTGGPRLDGASTREIKSELFDTLDILDTGGGESEIEEEEEETRPRKFVKRGAEEEAAADEEDVRPSKPVKGKTRQPVEEEEELPVAKPVKGSKTKPVEPVEDEEPVVTIKGKKTAKPAEPIEDEPPVVAVKAKKTATPAVVQEPEPPVVAKASKPPVVAKVEPVKVKAKIDDDENPIVAAKPSKAAKPVKPLVASATIDEENDEEDEAKKPPSFVPKTKVKAKAKAKPKAVAVADDDSDDGDSDASVSGSFEPLRDELALNPAHRAIDVTGGLSFTARRLRFTSAAIAAPGKAPRSYDSIPVAGITVDGEAYPMAYGHKRRGFLTNIGVTAMFDRTLSIRTRLRYTDATNGMAREKELQSTYQRFAVGALYRHNLGSPERPLLVTGGMRFGSQSFTVDRGGLDAVIVDIPAVKYTIFEPSVGIKYALNRRMTVGTELGILLMTSTGEIQSASQYGPATVTGFEGDAFFDFLITDKIFARAAFRGETIGFKFKGFGMLSNMRDADPEQDVSAARDTYFGGSITAGYLF